MNEHDILLKIIEEIGNDIKKSCKIKINKRKLDKKLLFQGEVLFPTFSFRTADLHNEMCKRLEGYREAEKLINECFGVCTLTTFYYIHLNDLSTIIERHKESGKWCVKLIDV